MLQPAHHLGFVKKHLAIYARPLLVILALNVVEFDCDVATVVGIVRKENPAGTTLANLVNDDVFADPLGNVGA